VERRFEADTSEEDGDEDLRVRGGLSVVGRGRRRPDRRGERGEGRGERGDAKRRRTRSGRRRSRASPPVAASCRRLR
jgi:hypothetical protein